jgi:hypothetical protein
MDLANANHLLPDRLRGRRQAGAEERDRVAQSRDGIERILEAVRRVA